MKGELFLKVKQRKEGEAGVETFPAFSVAAFDLVVVARSIRTCILEELELEGGDTGTWNDLHIHLNTLARVGHLFIGMAVRPLGLADQGFYAPVPPAAPEVDIRPALVVLSAGPADAIFFSYFITLGVQREICLQQPK